jgi:protein TonB
LREKISRRAKNFLLTLLVTAKDVPRTASGMATALNPIEATAALIRQRATASPIVVGENKMSVTVNAFPPLQSMTSPRGWVLAIIVGLHALFFWIFTSGLGPQIVGYVSSPPVHLLPPIDKEKPQVKRIVDPTIVKEKFETKEIYVPKLDEPTMDVDRKEMTVEQTTTETPPPTRFESQERPNTPVIEAPAVDARIPLSEPDYPASEVRGGHAGTVLLSVYVLENGRIGHVRIEQSSGFPKLDASAAREAKRWRMKPGTQDGRPVAMWKTIPITFRLNNLDM